MVAVVGLTDVFGSCALKGADEFLVSVDTDDLFGPDVGEPEVDLLEALTDRLFNSQQGSPIKRPSMSFNTAVHETPKDLATGKPINTRPIEQTIQACSFPNPNMNIDVTKGFQPNVNVKEIQTNAAAMQAQGQEALKQIDRATNPQGGSTGTTGMSIGGTVIGAGVGVAVDAVTGGALTAVCTAASFALSVGQGSLCTHNTQSQYGLVVNDDVKSHDYAAGYTGESAVPTGFDQGSVEIACMSLGDENLRFNFDLEDGREMIQHFVDECKAVCALTAGNIEHREVAEAVVAEKTGTDLTTVRQAFADRKIDQGQVGGGMMA